MAEVIGTVGSLQGKNAPACVYFMPEKDYKVAPDGHTPIIMKAGKAYPVAPEMAKHMVAAGRGKIVPAPGADKKAAKAPQGADKKAVQALVVELMEQNRTDLNKLAFDEGAVADLKEAEGLANKEAVATVIAKNRLEPEEDEEEEKED